MCFIVVEGVDGSGKTEVSKRLAHRLQAQIGAENALWTYEPHNDMCGGEFIRQALRHEVKVSDRTLLLAYAANREDHLYRVILPFLGKFDKFDKLSKLGVSDTTDKVVICDRYYLSSLVYQSTDNIAMEEVMSVNRQALQPDLTLFFDVNLDNARQRRHHRGGNEELFDSRMEMMRAKYEQAIRFLQKKGENIVRIDANAHIDIVVASALETINKIRLALQTN
jgi:dTMP kinase